MHDILGHYNRFDIFDLRVNAKQQQPFKFVDKEIKNGSESYEQDKS